MRIENLGGENFFSFYGVHLWKVYIKDFDYDISLLCKKPFFGITKMNRFQNMLALLHQQVIM